MKKYLPIILLVRSLSLIGQNVVIDRPSGGSGFVTSSEGGQGTDLYVADDFVLTETTTLGEMDFRGITNFTSIDMLETFNIIIYDDINGEPANNPTQSGTGIVELRNIPLSLINFEIVNSINMNFLNIPLTQLNNNSQITLDAGTYWFCAYATFTADPNLGSYWGIGRASIPDEGSRSKQFFSSTGEWMPITTSQSDPFSTIAFTLRDEVLLSTNNFDKSQEIVIYPNPASTEYTIKLPKSVYKEGNLHMHSADGRLVYSLQLNKIDPNGIIIDTSELLKGLYIINLKLDNTVITEKIIIN